MQNSIKCKIKNVKYLPFLNQLSSKKKKPTGGGAGGTAQTSYYSLQHSRCQAKDALQEQSSRNKWVTTGYGRGPYPISLCLFSSSVFTTFSAATFFVKTH